MQCQSPLKTFNLPSQNVERCFHPYNMGIYGQPRLRSTQKCGRHCNPRPQGRTRRPQTWPCFMQGQDGFIPSSNREEALSVLCFYMNILESELPMLTWEYVRIFANVAHWDNFKFCCEILLLKYLVGEHIFQLIHCKCLQSIYIHFTLQISKKY